MYLAKVSGFTSCVQLLTSSRVLFLKNLRTGKNLLTILRFKSESNVLENDILLKTRSVFAKNYFSNLIEGNPKYQACASGNSSYINENSTNVIVIKLRNLAEQKESNKLDVPAIEHFRDEIFTIDDLIEIFYLFSLPTVVAKLPFDLHDLISSLKKRNVDTGKNLSECLKLLHLIRKSDQRMFKSELAYVITDFIQKKIKYLTITQIIEYFYLLHFCKRIHFREDTKFRLETILESHVPKFTLDEVAVVAFGLFRSNHRPGILLTKTICNRVEESILACNEVQISVFSMFINFSGRRAIAETVEKILDKCVSIIDRFNLITAICVGCLGISVKVTNTKLLNRLLLRTEEEISTITIKDIERLLAACLCGNIHLTKESGFIRKIEEELKIRKEEIKVYPLPFINILQFLIMYEIYIDEQINFALSEDFHQYLSKGSAPKFPFQLLFIDVSMEIERPDYKGNKLSASRRSKIFKKSFYKNANEGSFWKCVNEIPDILKPLYGEKCCTLENLLPNYCTLHPVICMNENNEAMEVEGKLRKPWVDVIIPPKDGNKWICFVEVGGNDFSVSATPDLMTETQLRQLRKAGYIPIPIRRSSLRMKSTSEKHSYIAENLANALKNVKNR